MSDKSLDDFFAKKDEKKDKKKEKKALREKKAKWKKLGEDEEKTTTITCYQVKQQYNSIVTAVNNQC